MVVLKTKNLHEIAYNFQEGATMENEPRPQANETEPLTEAELDLSAEKLREVYPELDEDAALAVAEVAAEAGDHETAVGFLMTVLLAADVDEADATARLEQL